jgi:hypothetical protein
MKPIFVHKGALATDIPAACETFQNTPGIFERVRQKLCVVAIPAIKLVAATSWGLIVNNIT